MNRTNSTFGQDLKEFAKSILACVNVTYNGAEGSMHIDIVPINKNDAAPPRINGQKCPAGLLPVKPEETE